MFALHKMPHDNTTTRQETFRLSCCRVVVGTLVGATA